MKVTGLKKPGLLVDASDGSGWQVFLRVRQDHCAIPFPKFEV